MRIIQYPTTLIGGYSLFNHSDVTNPESDYGHPGYPGIRMSVIGHSTLAEVASAFDLVPIDMDDNPDFMNNFRQALLGEETHWKIVRVIVDYNTVRLQFASEYYYKEHYRLSDETDTSRMNNEEENKFIESLPQYIGYAEIEAKALRWVDLRFEVLPDEGCEGIDIVDVTLSQTGPVTVTEYEGRKKRIFEIRRPPAGEYCQYPAIVTECM